MPRRALIDKRPWLLASIAAALAFYYLRFTAFPEFYLIPIKGAAVGLLAVYAWMRHSSQDAKLLTGMMVIAAIGDMAMEVSVLVGGFVFFAYHVVALMLYLRHTRETLAQSQKYTAVALLFVTPLTAYLIVRDESTALYGLALGAMAAAAWSSSFPRYRVGAGAVLFVVSDLLLFAQMGPLQSSVIPAVFVWPLYYLGQFLICTGVVQTLRKRDPQLRAVR